jgi:uncharacterized protein (TIRG00374 family)
MIADLAMQPELDSLAQRQEDRAGRGFDRLGRRLAVPVGLGLLALVALALVAEARQLAQSLGAFDPRLLPPVLALSLLNYGLRFGRWQIYLRVLKVRLAWRTSLAVFLVGFVLSVTPGKVGELGKAWLARELGGGAARRTVAAVLAERLTDLLAMVLLVAGGALAWPGREWVAVGGLALSVMGLLILSWTSAAGRLFGLLGRLPRLGSRVGLLAEVYDRLRTLFRPGVLALAVPLSVLAWGAEGLACGLVVRHYASDASWLSAVFNYSLSTLLGALSMLPGGLLAAEGSLTALLGLQGVATAAAASATLLIRVATLWFAVALGLVALPLVLRKLRR